MTTRREFVAASIAALAGPASLSSALAAVIGKPAKILLGFSAGGSNDYLARQIAQRLSGTYAPNVIVENRVGAQGRIAAAAVKQAEPDGSGILQSNSSTMTLYQHIFKEMPYDPVRDFVPVTALANFDYVLVARADIGAASLGQFVDWCKANPKKATYASPAHGSAPHFVGLMLARDAGVELLHVPYKGASPAVQGLLGGEIPAYIGTYSDVAAHLPGKKLRILASSGPDRSRFTPDIPTFVELGLKEVESRQWFGISVPARTPQPVVLALNQAIVAALKTESMQASLTTQGMDAAGSTPAEFAERIRRESAKWASVVKAANFPLE